MNKISWEDDRTPPGSRVRLNDTCIWPERRGCEGVVVAPPHDGMYPQPAKSEVIVKLDADPLHSRPWDSPSYEWWTCVIDRKSVEAI